MIYHGLPMVNALSEIQRNTGDKQGKRENASDNKKAVDK
jgi:hypothetical protein